MARFIKTNRIIQNVQENGLTEWAEIPLQYRDLDVTVYAYFVGTVPTGARVDIQLTSADNPQANISNDYVVEPTAGANITAKQVIVGLGACKAIRARISGIATPLAGANKIEIHYIVQGGGNTGFDYLNGR